MTLSGLLFLLSPAALLAGSFLLTDRRARRIARGVGLAWLLLLAPAAWLSADCTGDELAYAACARTPAGLAAGLGTLTLVAFLGWMVVGPAAAIVAAVLELRARRR